MDPQLETEIAEWRAFVERAPAIDGRDVDELEAHLRDQIADLGAVGLSSDEAFLVAVKRLGSVDTLSFEYAREHSGRLWKHLVLADTDDDHGASRWGLEALGFAVLAALAVQLARVLSSPADDISMWLVRNIGLLVLPFLAAWFVRRRGLTARQAAPPFAAFVLAALVVNLVPYDEGASTELLVAAHLPVALWFVAAHPYMGGALGSHEKRMDVVRFTGEWAIYYALIALGGGVLMALMAGILEPAGVDVEALFPWILPSGAAGAVIVAAWLVESKQQVVENMAPVLTTIFTPLFALGLAVAAVVYAVTGLGQGFDRELLGVFDALMVVVLGLVLYGISARDPLQPPGWMDRIQLVAVVSALVLDLMVLGSMVARIGELGFTPNRTAALGLNLVLLVNLAGSAWWSGRFVAGRGTLHELERWQTTYLPVFAVWAAAVVVVLPPVFGYA